MEYPRHPKPVPTLTATPADFMFSWGNSIYGNPTAFIYFIPIYCSEVSPVILKYMTFLFIMGTNEINRVLTWKTALA